MSRSQAKLDLINVLSAYLTSPQQDCYGLTSIYRASHTSWSRKSSPLLSIHTHSHSQTRLYALGLLQEVWMPMACLGSLLFWYVVPFVLTFCGTYYGLILICLLIQWLDAYRSNDWLFPCYCSKVQKCTLWYHSLLMAYWYLGGADRSEKIAYWSYLLLTNP
jgi:hypothetical protein